MLKLQTAASDNLCNSYYLCKCITVTYSVAQEELLYILYTLILFSCPSSNDTTNILYGEINKNAAYVFKTLLAIDSTLIIWQSTHIVCNLKFLLDKNIMHHIILSINHSWHSVESKPTMLWVDSSTARQPNSCIHCLINWRDRKGCKFGNKGCKVNSVIIKSGIYMIRHFRVGWWPQKRNPLSVQFSGSWKWLSFISTKIKFLESSPEIGTPYCGENPLFPLSPLKPDWNLKRCGLGIRAATLPSSPRDLLGREAHVQHCDTAGRSLQDTHSW